MAIDLITGHQGVAHISADQIANINNALMDDYGVDKVVRLDDGTLTQDGLTINVGTGFWRVNGFDMEIQEAETVYIDPTVTGLSRIDNIYVEILQDIPTGAQRSEIVTAQGEAAASPVAPDAPTAPVLNTDILLQVTPLATVIVTDGAMVMTDLSVAYKMVTPQELAAVQTIAENAQTTANTANTSANNALGMIKDSSDAYSPSRDYKVGEYCIHDNIMHKCITPCSAAAWSVNQNCFEPTTLTKAVTDLNNDLGEKADTDDFLVTKVFAFFSGDGIGGYASKDFMHNFTRPTGYKAVALKEIVTTDGSFIFSVRNISDTTLTVRAFNCSGTVAYPGTISYTIIFAKGLKAL